MCFIIYSFILLCLIVCGLYLHFTFCLSYFLTTAISYKCFLLLSTFYICSYRNGSPRKEIKGIMERVGKGMKRYPEPSFVKYKG